MLDKIVNDKVIAVGHPKILGVTFDNMLGKVAKQVQKKTAFKKQCAK